MVIDELNSVILPGLDNKSVDFKAELSGTPVLLAFYKYNCPTCRFAMPFIERLYRKYGDSKYKFIAIAQDNEPETEQFRSDYGLSFAIALDKKPYEFSQMFNFQAVPAIVLISREGRILHQFEAFQKAEFEWLNRTLADGDVNFEPLFDTNEDIPALKPG